jgi:hypothetical protein
MIGGPLPPGTKLTFAGKPAADEVAVVNCYLNRHVYAIRLRSFHLVNGRGEAVIVLKGRTPTLRLTGIRGRMATFLVAPGTR